MEDRTEQKRDEADPGVLMGLVVTLDGTGSEGEGEGEGRVRYIDI